MCFKTCSICYKYCKINKYCNDCNAPICKKCLMEWFNNNIICPICRSDKEIIYINNINLDDIESDSIKIKLLCNKNKIHPEEDIENKKCCENTKNRIEYFKCICEFFRFIIKNHEDSCIIGLLKFIFYTFILFLIGTFWINLFIFIDHINKLDELSNNLKQLYSNIIVYIFSPLIGFISILCIAILLNCCKGCINILKTDSIMN